MERRDLARYLRQLRELGGPDVFLDRLTADGSPTPDMPALMRSAGT